jgi:hypothetical protein
MLVSQGFDACRLAQGRDVLISWRALFERSELVRPPQAGVRHIWCGQTRGHWFWGLLPKQKGLACRGETRQHRKLRGHQSGGPHAPCIHLPTVVFLA